MTDYNSGDNKTFGDRYEIQSKIARGGMADVYLANDSLLDRPVALKVLFPELSIDPSFVERFRREAQNAAKLNHPNIVSVYDWGEDANTYYIVMEYIDGRSLSTILREDGPLKAERAAHIGAEVGSALSFAHHNGVVHRDVKPGNVLIDRNGSVKVTDFGIARARNTTENLTQTGAVMGTATYFSPEQAQGMTVDERSDVYSLGVVLYEMVAGKPPFVGDNPVTIAYKHVRENPVPLRDLNSGIPATYATIVNKALAKSPASRYQTAEDLRADLQRFTSGMPIKARPSPDVTQVNQRSVQAAYADSTRTIPAVPPRPPVVPTDAPGARKRGVAVPLLVFISLLALIAIGLIVLFNMGGGSGPEKVVTIPSVVGKNKDDATAQLKALKLQVTITDQADSSSAGTVLSQNPAGNTQGHQNDVVQLTVSTGPQPVTLDDYTNQSASSAQSSLQQAGFKVQINQQSSDSVPANTVISQSPSSGTQVSPGSTVTLNVSSGPAQVTVPNLVGYTISSAAQTLSNLGLRTSYPDNADPTDVVEGMDPSPNTQVSKGTTINLTPQSAGGASTSTTSSSSTTSTTTHSHG
jgi:eukaryotic-like serine/threonine-protein kinase